MINIRSFEKTDLSALQKAIDADTFHSGEWSVRHFYDDPDDEKALKIPKVVNVIEDDQGPIAFVRYTKTLRISCVWNDGADVHRNARAIIQGIRDAVERAQQSGFTELIITTSHQKLADFFTKVLKMSRSQDEYTLQV